MRRSSFLRVAALTLMGIFAMAMVPGLMAQTWQPGAAGIGFGKPPSKQWVQMVSSPDLVVSARGRQGGESQNVPLRFAIQTGMHINSHTPNSRFLIPTTLTFGSQSGVEVARVEYPAGVDYHFSFSPKDALSVYTGEFGVLVRVRAKPGKYTLQGKLRYQACDSRACNPPRSLPLTLHVIAK